MFVMETLDFVRIEPELHQLHSQDQSLNQRGGRPVGRMFYIGIRLL